METHLESSRHSFEFETNHTPLRDSVRGHSLFIYPSIYFKDEWYQLENSLLDGGGRGIMIRSNEMLLSKLAMSDIAGAQSEMI